jgi:hypothetical protein
MVKTWISSLYILDGKIYEGNWENGDRYGIGFIILLDETQIVGVWVSFRKDN